MTETQPLRTAIVGLLRCAATEDELLLISTSDSDADGSAELWAAVPTVAHNTEFKRQQVIRLEAVLHNQTPPQFSEIEHRSEHAYSAYAAQRRHAVAEESRRTTNDLVDALLLLADDDLIDPSEARMASRPAALVADHRPRFLASDGARRRLVRRSCDGGPRYRAAPPCGCDRRVSAGTGSVSRDGVVQPRVHLCDDRREGRSGGSARARCRAQHDLRERIVTEPDLETLLEDDRVVALIG